MKNSGMRVVDVAGTAVQTGHVYKYDLSVPINHFHEIVEMTREKVNMVHKDALICGYGHVGDSNVHLNVCTPGEFDESAAVLSTIEPFVYDVTRDWGGSISAEHGLGQMKPEKIFHSKSVAAVKVMRDMKNSFDPRGIMNPGKVLPSNSHQ